MLVVYIWPLDDNREKLYFRDLYLKFPSMPDTQWYQALEIQFTALHVSTETCCVGTTSIPLWPRFHPILTKRL